MKYPSKSNLAPKTFGVLASHSHLLARIEVLPVTLQIEYPFADYVRVPYSVFFSEINSRWSYSWFRSALDPSKIITEYFISIGSFKHSRSRHPSVANTIFVSGYQDCWCVIIESNFVPSQCTTRWGAVRCKPLPDQLLTSFPRLLFVPVKLPHLKI